MKNKTIYALTILPTQKVLFSNTRYYPHMVKLNIFSINCLCGGNIMLCQCKITGTNLLSSCTTFKFVIFYRYKKFCFQIQDITLIWSILISSALTVCMEEKFCCVNAKLLTPIFCQVVELKFVIFYWLTKLFY